MVGAFAYLYARQLGLGRFGKAGPTFYTFCLVVGLVAVTAGVWMLRRRQVIVRMTPSALELRGLTKTFDRPAVDCLDLTVRRGEFYCLLGPNGAGKTTTLRMVAGLLAPDHGSISVFGIDALADPVAAKQIMAWVSD